MLPAIPLLTLAGRTRPSPSLRFKVGSRLTATRTPEIRQSIEIFSWSCFGHCHPEQGRCNNGSCREDQNTFPIAECFEKKSGCGGTDRSGDGDHGAECPAH